MTIQKFTITKMGQLGEGVASNGLETDDPRKPVFIPYALPGETLLADMSAERPLITQIIAPSMERVVPFCKHFGTCGSCAIQHWADEPYRAWKRELVVTALSFEQLTPLVDTLIDAHGDGRRRALLNIRFMDGKPVAGFMEPKSHRVVNLDQCPILVPQLDGCADIARLLAKPLMALRKPLTIQFTATLSGLDVDIRGPGKIEFNTRMVLTDLATELDLARLSIHGDIVVERRQPVLKFGRVPVSIQPGGFTQATQLGEETLGQLVVAGVGEARKVADLFCGNGPFALRLAEKSIVYAADCDEAGITALKRGVNLVQGLKPVIAETRDLFRKPMLAFDLNSFNAIVLDPPRAGAEAQCREIAASKVKHVVSVSCNAASFARDASILVVAGFTLERVTPVDQFKHSPHVEMVGVFKRG